MSPKASLSPFHCRKKSVERPLLSSLCRWASRVCSEDGNLSCSIYVYVYMYVVSLDWQFLNRKVTENITLIINNVALLFLSVTWLWMQASVFLSTVGLVFPGNVYFVNENLFLCLQLPLASQRGCYPLCIQSLLSLSRAPSVSQIQIWTQWTGWTQTHTSTRLSNFQFNPPGATFTHFLLRHLDAHRGMLTSGDVFLCWPELLQCKEFSNKCDQIHNKWTNHILS